MKQLTEKQAKAFYNSKAYEAMTARQIAEFQIEQDYLCMPFKVYRKAMEETLDRPVWAHEFGLNVDGLRKELRRDGMLRHKRGTSKLAIR